MASSSIILLFLVAFAIRDAHASVNSWSYAAHNNIAGRRRSTLAFSPWKQAHATFYEGGSGTFGGACGYEDVVKDGYGMDTAAVSTSMFKGGETCGGCYEIRCVASDSSSQQGQGGGCNKGGQSSIFVTATNLCPPNYNQAGDNGGWCNPPREHFDLAKPAFLKIAQYKTGIVPVQYRRVPCKKQGGIRYTITGNPYFNLVKVWNVGGAGNVVGVQVKGDDKLKWTEMKRNWGQKWETNAMLVGESLTFRVRASDERYSTSWHVAPKNWQFGQTFEGKNFN
ncbi:Expansin-A32 [Stylosanthes scabra]|uniref:Expansin n=1 Tax=Stylosanthes scabra TaxID=79078 RepID=A0ABU6ZH68_9FABA|nr:Expansin-A32 [Stylosanthes scabra]